MAHAETHSVELGSQIVSVLTAPFRAVWNFLIYLAETNTKTQELERYSAMTDDELAERGMEREDIVRVVFRAYLHS